MYCIELEGEDERMELLKAARLLEINVVTSSPLMQGVMNDVPLPDNVFKFKDNGARHLQFTRSIPAKSLISTLLN